MASHCETFDHTADVGLRAGADTLAELLSALGEGLAELICPRSQVRPLETRTCSVRAEDVEALTVDFLWRVMDTILFDGFAVAAVRVDYADERAVDAMLVGEALSPERHELATEVKAVTYHELAVGPDGDGWTGQVILDL